MTSGPTSRHYVSQRLRLHYADWGNREADPVLLVHGGRDHCRSWDWVARELCGDFRVLAPDLRGHGDSDWSLGGSYGIAEVVHDLDELILQENLAPVTIVGHSLGGAASLLHAGLRPERVRRLAVIEGTWMLDPAATGRSRRPIAERLAGWSDRLRDLAAREPRRYASLDEAAERMLRENPYLTAEQARHLTIHGAVREEDGTYRWKFDSHIRVLAPNRFTDQEVVELWSRIACPVLLIAGGTSQHGNPEKLDLLRHFRDARAVEIAGAGHWPHHEKLAEVLAHLRPFLAG